MSTTILRGGRVIDPAAGTVERAALPKLSVWPVVQNGAPRDKVDLLLMGDGYTAAEMEKWSRVVTEANIKLG